jgi:transcriptional/translational regulatory protein YebC/TACO1
MRSEETTYAVMTEPQDLEKVKKAIEESNVQVEAAEITNVPKSTIKVTGDDAQKVLALVTELEEHDDVQNVYANFDIPDEILKKLEEEA